MALNVKRKDQKTKADELIEKKAAQIENANNSVTATIQTLSEAEKEKKSADPVPQNRTNTVSKNEDKVNDEAFQESESQIKDRKKPGRKKIRSEFMLNIAFRKDIEPYVKLAATIKCQGNVTGYINALVEKDIEENLDAYQKIHEQMNNL